MSEKPILFNTEMVKAIMQGRKTVTRRIIKKVNGKDFIGYVTCSVPKGDEGKAAFGRGNLEDIANANIEQYVRPPYKVGDILYVRETWSTQYNGVNDDNGYGAYVYKADGVELDNSEGNCSRWKPSIHMPKEAARIFLRVTDVSVERLQAMKYEDFNKEGFLTSYEFMELWDKTIKKEDLKFYSYKTNPWVWAIEFEVVTEDYETGKYIKVFE